MGGWESDERVRKQGEEGKCGEQVRKRWKELRDVDKQLATPGVRSLTDNGSTL